MLKLKQKKRLLINFEDVHVNSRSESSGGVCRRGPSIISEVKSVIVILGHHPSAFLGGLIALTFLRHRTLIKLCYYNAEIEGNYNSRY